MKQRTFSRSKNQWDNEEVALADVCTKMEVKPSELTAAHTDEKFVWKTFENESQFPTVGYEKANHSEEEATALAMADLGDTFEGNLSALHNDTHFLFTKVRA